MTTQSPRLITLITYLIHSFMFKGELDPKQKMSVIGLETNCSEGDLQSKHKAIVLQIVVMLVPVFHQEIPVIILQPLSLASNAQHML